MPLEVKFHHDPNSTWLLWGGARSNVIHWWKNDAGKWQWEKIIDVENEPIPNGRYRCRGNVRHLVQWMTDISISTGCMATCANMTSPIPNPKLTGQVWMGGLLGKHRGQCVTMAGGPQMFQLSLDGRRLYVTTSLFSTWDNQFYPEIREKVA